MGAVAEKCGTTNASVSTLLKVRDTVKPYDTDGIDIRMKELSFDVLCFSLMYGIHSFFRLFIH